MSVLSNQNGHKLSIICKSRRNFRRLRQKQNPISYVIDAEFLWRTFFALNLLFCALEMLRVVQLDVN